MSDEHRPTEERNAGAFMGPGGTFPAAMHTLSDEIPSEPSELEVERRGVDRGGAGRDPGWARSGGLRRRLRRLFGRPEREAGPDTAVRRPSRPR